MGKIRALLDKHRELISYVFWGGMTTAVNYVSYTLLTEGLHIYYLTGTVIAWIISVLFAYFVNKIFVFQSRGWGRKALRELWQMTASRLFSLGLEMAIMWFFVDLLLCPHLVVKLAANVVVVIVNYVLSKWVIFRKNA